MSELKKERSEYVKKAKTDCFQMFLCWMIAIIIAMVYLRLKYHTMLTGSSIPFTLIYMYSLYLIYSSRLRSYDRSMLL